jgi:phosphoribosylaminoimidazole-succinocarboxamide synthase
MIDESILRRGLTSTLERTDFPTLGAKYEGKVRDNYSPGDGRRWIMTTDRISAFDHVLGTIPFKGQILTRLAAFWFDKLSGVAKSHYKSMPDPNVLECVECEPLKVEMVVRAYLTGTTSTSIWVHYESGERKFCGHELPDGMRKHQRLERPILTPSTKAPKGEHDISGSREDILATGQVTAADFDAAAAIAMKLFQAGSAACAERGLILVDTKYEFGKNQSGEIVVIDEMHTPDSSRFWYAASYEQRMKTGSDPDPLDKDFVRRWYSDRGYRGDGPPPPMPDEVRMGAAMRYAEAFERITGTTFVPDRNPPLERIAKNLGVTP